MAGSLYDILPQRLMQIYQAAANEDLVPVVKCPHCDNPVVNRVSKRNPSELCWWCATCNTMFYPGKSQLDVLIENLKELNDKN